MTGQETASRPAARTRPASGGDGAAELGRLLARIALADACAFEQLYRATSAHLLGVSIRILKDRDRAEEVLQEAFVNVWNSAGGYLPHAGSPMTWLINIVRNKSIDALRSRRALREHTDALDDEHEALHDEGAGRPEDLLERSLMNAHVAACMTAVCGPPQRQAIALAYYQGFGYVEIAAAMDVPVNTVKSWVRRGLERMRHCLEESGVVQ